MTIRNFLGWQIANQVGENIQGDDPSGYSSYRILNSEEAERFMRDNHDKKFLLMPIYEGDIEEPEMPQRPPTTVIRGH